MAASTNQRAEFVCPRRTGTGSCPIELGQEMDLALCTDLERVADRLPKLPGGAELRRLSERLQAASARWADPEIRAVLEGEATANEARLMDGVHAEDVADALWRHWRDPQHANTGELAYMLRALFDGRRRAIALERLWLGCSSCQLSEND